MLFSSILLSLLSFYAVCAVPTPADKHERSTAATSLSQALGQNCPLSNIQLPTAPTPLPTPTGTLAHVLIGRGVQNYTCDLGNATAVPVAVGAIATLYDASCAFSSAPQLTTMLTSMAYGLRTDGLPTLSNDPVFDKHFDGGAGAASLVGDVFEQQLTPFVVGHHFFMESNGTLAPRFDLDTSNAQDGTITAAKVAVSAPPSDAQAGSVEWLYLDSPAGQSQSYSQVYRVETVGGNPPATCKLAGKAAFSVRYAAQYFFYQ